MYNELGAWVRRGAAGAGAGAPGVRVRPGRAQSRLCHARCRGRPAPSCVGRDHAGRRGGAGRDSCSAQR
eukprot:890307-Rhodomonas_salina.1